MTQKEQGKQAQVNASATVLRVTRYALRVARRFPLFHPSQSLQARHALKSTTPQTPDVPYVMTVVMV